jgi:hypothetical protein
LGRAVVSRLGESGPLSTVHLESLVARARRPVHLGSLRL